MPALISAGAPDPLIGLAIVEAQLNAHREHIIAFSSWRTRLRILAGCEVRGAAMTQ